jgi:hypothetical protein
MRISQEVFIWMHVQPLPIAGRLTARERPIRAETA